MKAFTVDRYGHDGRFGEMPEPQLRDDDVLVQIHAAGVNPLDSKIRDGEFKLIMPHPLPLILGNDLAGVVVRVGARAQQFKPGDEVYARPPANRFGAFAELIAINQDALAIKPKNLTMEEAASIPLVGLTAWQALVERANLKADQKVLIHAGSGGVGTFAIQLAKHLGAVVATTTSTANVDLVKRLGADVVIDYKKDDFTAIVRDYDIVLNGLNADTLEKSLRVLKPGGKLISISGPPDPDFAKEIGANLLLKLVMGRLSVRIRKQAKRQGVSYSFLFMRANGAQLREITSLIEGGFIRPVVDQVFPFERTSDALAYVETGRSKGKVVVEVRWHDATTSAPSTPHTKETNMSIIDMPQYNSSSAWKDARTQFVDVDGTNFAYRQLGPNTGVPVIFLNHLAAELDRWDPRVVDGIAAQRRVIVFDNRGVGASEGSTPTTVDAMARDAIAFIRALGYEQVDLFGFSLGGFISQAIALEAPELVRKIILAGTGPAGGEGIDKVTSLTVRDMIRAAVTFKHPEYYLFFTESSNGRRSARDFLRRLKERDANRDKPVALGAFINQLEAIHAWGVQAPADLSRIRQPVLVANGDHDKMVPSTNSVDLARRLPNSELVLYDDAGHGGVFQNHGAFVTRALEFLGQA